MPVGQAHHCKSHARTREAVGLAVGREAILLADVTERLPDADIVISSTGSQLPI